MLLLMHKLNRDTKIQSEVSGTLQNPWDNEIYTAAILVHGNNISAGIRGSPCPTWRIAMNSLSDEYEYHHPNTMYYL